MKLAISNIAWNKGEDVEVAVLLKKYQITGIEVAPTKIWDNPLQVSDTKIKRYKKFWADKNIQIVALCSLLYGHPELTIFENETQRENTIAYLSQMIVLASKLGSKRLVFGAPKNRKYHNLKPEKVFEIAKDFFYRLSELAKQEKVFLCIEPNPVQYDTNFINTTSEAVDFINQVGHPNLRLHMDTSTMSLNKENYQKSIEQGQNLTEHFHISEDYLKQIGSANVNHQEIARILNQVGYSKWLSIEMPGIKGANIARVERALKYVKGVYGG